MNIPQGYKHTELGIIPEDWALQSVGKHCIVKARIGWQGLRSDEYLESGEYGLITSTDIIDGIIRRDGSRRVLCDQYAHSNEEE